MATTNQCNIDEEWKNFISCKYDDDDDDVGDEDNFADPNEFDFEQETSSELTSEAAPISTPIYISTKTKISYLNMAVDLKEIFWKIPVIPYAEPKTGVIKKQIKINSLTQEELDDVQEKLKHEKYFEEYVMTSIRNPNGRIKFKDIRKITIGISKKDLMSYRCRKKSAFYNCFVLILRIKVDSTFKEFHVKIFNTGKLEIPGIQTEETFQKTLEVIIDTLQPYFSEKLEYQKDTTETVLINSNFNCGFYINREALYDILKYKYNIQSIYDPCSYPGIQSKFYYNPDVGIQTGSQISEENKAKFTNISEVSFMIFRTGSVLIVGKCDESVLLVIYEFLKNLLTNEFAKIGQRKTKAEASITKDKKKKIRRKQIIVNLVEVN
jgi:TATA-box binding protein (TBP) (component of TFIID and TFIIIB)